MFVPANKIATVAEPVSVEDHLNYFSESVAAGLGGSDFDELFGSVPNPLRPKKRSYEQASSTTPESFAPPTHSKAMAAESVPAVVRSISPQPSSVVTPNIQPAVAPLLPAPTLVMPPPVLSSPPSPLPAISSDDESNAEAEKPDAPVTKPKSKRQRYSCKDDRETNRRERNREHAKRSRQRKKESTNALQEAMEALKAENEKLRLLLNLDGDQKVERTNDTVGSSVDNDAFIRFLQNPENRILGDEAISEIQCLSSRAA